MKIKDELERSYIDWIDKLEALVERRFEVVLLTYDETVQGTIKLVSEANLLVSGESFFVGDTLADMKDFSFGAEDVAHIHAEERLAVVILKEVFEEVE
jgi:hypothetical protein